MNTEELREAIQQAQSNPYDPYDSTVLKAAQSYLALLTKHPEIEGLIKGTHEIIEIDISCPVCKREDCEAETYEECINRAILLKYKEL